MEKKGNLLTQIGIIVDLIDRANMETTSQTMIFGLNPDEYKRVYEIIQAKYPRVLDISKSDEFTLSIGTVDIIFSKNNA